MEVLVNKSIDRVFNLSIDHLIEYIYNGIETDELLVAFNQLSNYINNNVISTDDTIYFNRLKEIVSIVSNIETDYNYLTTTYSNSKESTLKEKIKLLQQNYK